MSITSRRRVAVARPTPPVNSCVIISYRSNHLYVAPSRRLVAETQYTLKTFGVDPMVITSDTHAGHVKAGIIEFMNHAEDAGQILLITWNAYVDLPYLNRRENWRVIIDEVPQWIASTRGCSPQSFLPHRTNRHRRGERE